MTAKFSTVHHDGEVGDEFTQVPNALIRDPKIKPASKTVILWFASQSEGRIIYVSKIADETGMTRKTVAKAIADALTTRYLARTPTGGRDSQGNETYVYRTDLTPCVETTRGRGEKLPTKKITENTNAKNLPSTTPLPREPKETGHAAATKKLTALASPYDPKQRHLRKIAQLNLDVIEVMEFFNSMHYCDEPGCDKKPRSSSWDAKLSKFIDAFADDRQEVDFTNHYTMHHDPEMQAIFDHADRVFAERAQPDEWPDPLTTQQRASGDPWDI